VTAFLQIDLPALLTATFAAMLCALLGNLLVLRRESLLGDAVSHSVLPGIVVGFLVVGSRTTLPMLAGAAIAGVLATLLIRALTRLGRIEPGAAMGVVFTSFFALGVLLIEVAAARSVDLDADCVLYGQLEDVLWLSLRSPADLLTLESWAAAPRELLTVAAFLAVSAAVLVFAFKEIKIVAFDPAFAAAIGLPVRSIETGLAAFVALAAVGSFEAVGSILVVALLICPAATARLLTDRYTRQMGLSIALGVFSALSGYALATLGPAVLGLELALNAAGTIACMSGLLLALAAVFAPRHGMLARRRAGSRPIEGMPRIT
jgi:manganese/zinc/iron transport system permease protein